jgi:hypothetical protein
MNSRRFLLEVPLSRPLAELFWPVALPFEIVPSQFLVERGVGPKPIVQAARDGRFLLERYFREVPRPRGAEERLLLPWRHRQAVPGPWRESVSFYRYSFQGAAASAAAPRSVLVCGTFFPGISRIDAVKSRLARVRSALLPLLQAGAQVKANFGFTPVDGVSSRETSFENELLSAFFELFGNDVEVLSWQEVIARPNYLGWRFVELGAPALCAESFLTQQLLSRGAIPALPAYQGLASAGAGAEWSSIPVSPYHEIQLTGGDCRSFLAAWLESSRSLRAATYGFESARG